MKKSLVFAMAMALGVTASAYAANPFSDVPAGHWAYDSVNKLAAAGIVDGYGNGTFGGDRLMTRYEMAQIVAKAMAKGANVDRLAAEFADELDSLGVRVAALEKKSDNVKITGQVRYDYTDYSGDIDGYRSKIRSRIFLTGQINDDWKYVGMLQNEQDLTNDVGDEGTDFKRAYVNGRVGGVGLQAGRIDAFLADGNIMDAQADGLVATYGDRIKVKAYMGKASDDTDFDINNAIETRTIANRYYGGEVSGDIGDSLNLAAGYVKFQDVMGKEYGKNDGIWHVGAAYNFNDDLVLSGMYLNSNWDGERNSDDDGWTVGLNYKGAKASDAGSYGIFARYYDQGEGTYWEHTTDANTFWNTGFKGYAVGADYAVAKNIVATLAYYDTKAKTVTSEGDNLKDKRLWTDVTFTF